MQASTSLEEAKKIPSGTAEWVFSSGVSAGSAPWSFDVDFRQPVLISSLDLKNKYSDHDTVKNFRLQQFLTIGKREGRWIDVQKWTSPQSSGPHHFIFPNTVAQYLRVLITTAYGGHPCVESLSFFGDPL